MIYTIEISQENNKREYNIEVSRPLLFLGDISDEIVIIGGHATLYRKIGISKYGKSYLLDTPLTEKLINGSQTRIELFDGDNQIKIIGSTGKSYIKYLLKNDFNETFATKIELSTSITQTNEKIILEASKKVGTNEIISRINQSPEAIVISANKISLAGKTINLTSDNISINSNNFRVNEQGDLWANNGTFSGVINGSTINGGTVRGGTIIGGHINGSSVSGGILNVGSNGGYIRCGIGYTHPNVSGLNVSGGYGININGVGFNVSDNIFKFSNGVQSYDLKSIGGAVWCNRITCSHGNPINILSGGASGNASGGGMLLRTGSGHITLDAANGGGNVYAAGMGASSSKVLTNSGQASSKNTKKNFIKFNNDKYQKALKILREINIYDYEYKYKLYQNNQKYGFIIDEIEKLDNYNEFFDFYKEKALINKDKTLDFAVTNDYDIEVKKYDSDVLDKYMLTCLKGMQQEIDFLKKEIKMLKGGKNGY